MEHPSAFEIESWHADASSVDPESVETIERHLSECSRCRELLGELDAAREEFAGRKAASDFIAEVTAKANGRVVWRRFATPIAGTLAAAATVLLLLTSRGEEPKAENDASSISHTVSLKGALSASVLRLRGSTQTVHHGELGVAPGDRLRLQLVVSEATVLSAGVLVDDGSWVTLFSSQPFSAGRHFPERTLDVTADPKTGRIIVGEPDAVRLARDGRDAAVETIDVRWEPER